MVNTINMQDMRYLNLFQRITQISTRFCFKYNETIFFCVPKPLISKAVGENGRNIKKLGLILGKKIKVVPAPRGIADARNFIESIINPVTFRDFEISGSEIIIIPGNANNKASLLGRNKHRLLEMQKIVEDFFDKELKII